MMQFDPVDRSTVKNLKFQKIQDGGGRHLEKSKNRHIFTTHYGRRRP